jgi:CHC2 zinc finger
MEQISEDALRELQIVLEAFRAKYPLQKVLASSGVRLRRDEGGCAIANCPFPSHLLRSPTFKVNLSNPDKFWCEACGIGGDVFDYVGAINGASFLANQFKLLTQEPLSAQVSSRYADEIERITSFCRKEEIERTIAPDAVASTVYWALLKRLRLYKSHRSRLLKRGLTVQDLELNEYRSLPPSAGERVEIAEDLVAEGHRLEAIPGFFRVSEDAPDANLRGRWCFGGDIWGRRVNTGFGRGSCQIGGVLIPVCDRIGQVVRLLVENDPPPPDAPWRVKNNWAPETTVLSPGLVDRTGGFRLHHAGKPDSTGRYSNALWVTDGALRADFVASHLRTRVIGVPWYGLLMDEVFEEARFYEQVYFTFDGPEFQQIERVCSEPASVGVETYVAKWDFVRTRQFGESQIQEEGGLQWVISFETWLCGGI